MLCGHVISELGAHMASTGSRSSCYHSNITAVQDWCVMLQSKPCVDSGKPYHWISLMLKSKPSDRCTAQVMFDDIQAISFEASTRFSYGGLCCIEDEDSAESVLSSASEHEVLDTTSVSRMRGKSALANPLLHQEVRQHALLPSVKNAANYISESIQGQVSVSSNARDLPVPLLSYTDMPSSEPSFIASEIPLRMPFSPSTDMEQHSQIVTHELGHKRDPHRVTTDYDEHFYRPTNQSTISIQSKFPGDPRTVREILHDWLSPLHVPANTRALSLLREPHSEFKRRLVQVKPRELRGGLDLLNLIRWICTIREVPFSSIIADIIVALDSLGIAYVPTETGFECCYPKHLLTVLFGKVNLGSWSYIVSMQNERQQVLEKWRDRLSGPNWREAWYGYDNIGFKIDLYMDTHRQEYGMAFVMIMGRPDYLEIVAEAIEHWCEIKWKGAPKV